jgi:hypothetical protein
MWLVFHERIALHMDSRSGRGVTGTGIDGISIQCKYGSFWCLRHYTEYSFRDSERLQSRNSIFMLDVDESLRQTLVGRTAFCTVAREACVD